MNTSEPARCAAANSTTGQQCANLARRGEWCQVHTESSRRYTGDGRLYRVCSAPNCQALATMVARYATLTTLLLRWECQDGHQWEERILPGSPSVIEVELLHRPEWLDADPPPNVEEPIATQLPFDIEPPEVAH
jgi:hypothetical protein